MSDREWSRSPSPLKTTSMQAVLAEEEQREQNAPTPGRTLSRAEKLEQKRKTAKGDALELPGFSMNAFGRLPSTSAAPFRNSPVQSSQPAPPGSSGQSPRTQEHASPGTDKQRKRPKPKPVTAASKTAKQKEQSSIPVKDGSTKKNPTASTSKPDKGKAPPPPASDASNSPSSSDNDEDVDASGKSKQPKADGAKQPEKPSSARSPVKSPAKSSAKGSSAQVNGNTTKSPPSKRPAAAPVASGSKRRQEEPASASDEESQEPKEKSPPKNQQKVRNAVNGKQKAVEQSVEDTEEDEQPAERPTSKGQSKKPAKTAPQPVEEEPQLMTRGRKRASDASQDESPQPTRSSKRRKSSDVVPEPVAEEEEETEDRNDRAQGSSNGKGKRKAQAVEDSGLANGDHDSGSNEETEAQRPPVKKAKGRPRKPEEQVPASQTAKSTKGSKKSATEPQAKKAKGDPKEAKKKEPVYKKVKAKTAEVKANGKGKTAQSTKSKGKQRQVDVADDEDVPPGFSDNDDQDAQQLPSAKTAGLLSVIEPALSEMSASAIDVESAQDHKRAKASLKAYKTNVLKRVKELRLGIPSKDTGRSKLIAEIRSRELHLRDVRKDQAEEESLWDASRAKKRITRRLHDYATRLSTSAQFFDTKRTDLSRLDLDIPDRYDVESTMRVFQSLAAPQDPIQPSSGHSRASFDLDSRLKGTNFNERLGLWNDRFQGKLDEVERGDEGMEEEEES